MFYTTKYETKAKELFGEGDNPFAFRSLTRLANHVGKVLENQSGDNRRMVLEIMNQIFCPDCGERHDDEALSIPIEQRCRCVLWCDE